MAKRNGLCVDLERCTGCRSCELACSFHLFSEFSPEQSAIRILLDEKSGEVEFKLHSSCDLCKEEEEAQCVKYCAPGALVRILKDNK